LQLETKVEAPKVNKPKAPGIQQMQRKLKKGEVNAPEGGEPKGLEPGGFYVEESYWGPVTWCYVILGVGFYCTPCAMYCPWGKRNVYTDPLGFKFAHPKNKPPGAGGWVSVAI
jgi:hypothetical protein